ncbi:hypothetical protein [Clostridium oryzae]|uniref:Polynucleotide kinase n=1 Tax=Clostridium oryzae TaxID=1450648 RepID=A0A1V4IDS4_9CLOT|nr:hypothetical protein [Clostridium oryzae]OPJ58103.1 hypothetical protein CLORY_37800 [Clostridium oryzae]
MRNKRTIVFDFDGVIHKYNSGWKGVDVIPDEPVEGIRDVIADLRKDYRVTVVSSRCSRDEGVKAVKQWLKDNDIQVDEVTGVKVPAIAYIDDRAINFNGKADELRDKIRNFRTWLQ